MTNLIESPEAPSPALTFEQMATRIHHNASNGFGGAVVIHPPANGGSVVAFLLLDETQDPVQFWTLVQSKAGQAIAELGETQKDPWSRR